MAETQPIDIITKDFCEKVIENTVSQLRTINGEISDDTLERFKAQWEHRWKTNLEAIDKEAQEKKNARDMLSH